MCYLILNVYLGLKRVRSVYLIRIDHQIMIDSQTNSRNFYISHQLKKNHDVYHDIYQTTRQGYCSQNC